MRNKEAMIEKSKGWSVEKRLQAVFAQPKKKSKRRKTKKKKT